MVICSSTNQLITLLQKSLSHCSSVCHYPFLILYKLRLHCFIESNCFSSYYMLERTALNSREDITIQNLTHHFYLPLWGSTSWWILKILSHKNNSSSRSTKGLMSGRG